MNDFEGSARVSVLTYRRHLAEVMPFPVRKFVFSNGNNRGDFWFLWRVDPDLSANDELLRSNKCISDVKKDIPVYHTRAMRRQFAEKAGWICDPKPSQLRALYRELTGGVAWHVMLELQINEVNSSYPCPFCCRQKR